MAANEDSFKFEYGLDFPAAFDLLSMAVQNRTIGHGFSPAELITELNLAGQYMERTPRRPCALPMTQSVHASPSVFMIVIVSLLLAAEVRASAWSQASSKAKWRQSLARMHKQLATV